MPASLLNCLREDLIVTRTTDQQTSAKRYLIKDPASEETFEFGEEEYFLCKLMDGVRTIPEILAAFQERFNIEISEADYQGFVRQIDSLGLLESTAGQLESPQANWRNSRQESSANRKKAKDHSLIFLWKHPSPQVAFSRLARWTSPFHRFLKWSTWLLVPLLPIALFTFWDNMHLFWRDVKIFVDGVPFILTYLADILLLNLCGRIMQATVFSAYGGQQNSFGLTLALGFKPHFYVNLREYQSMPRNVQMWIYATPLIMRLFVFSFGIVFWYAQRNSGTAFSTWILLLAHASLATFLFMACPLWPLYGYYFMVAAFRLPDNFLSQSFKAWGMILRGRRLPSFLSTREKINLVGFGLGSTAFCLFMLVLLINNFAKGLATTFPGLFGTQTAIILLSVLLIIGLRKPISRWFFSDRNSPVVSGHTASLAWETNNGGQRTNPSRPNWKLWFSKGMKFFLLAGLVALLFLPYPTKPGGTLQLLTPRQVEIQAEVDGKSKITRVMFPGGNEQFIRKGTVIAQMQDIDLEGNVDTLQSQIEKAQGDLRSKQSYLDKLLATPRAEDVEVARSQVESAREEVEQAKKQIAVSQQDLEVIKKQIENALSQADFYFREVDRLQVPYKEGAISLQLVEDARRMAEANRIEAEEKRQTLLKQQKSVEQARSELATKQRELETSQSHLKLVLSGPYPDEIEAAKHEVEAARSEIEKLIKEQQQSRSKLKLTTLIMPLDGYLVTPYLETKVGSYLEQGETFAIAQDATSIIGEVQVPEYDVGQFSIGKKVEIKLAAYPNETIVGKVAAITPSASDSTEAATSEQSSGRFVKVLVEIPYSGRILKTGMSGYAKIEGPTKPVIVAFTTPIVRFFQIEIWSWLP